MNTKTMTEKITATGAVITNLHHNPRGEATIWAKSGNRLATITEEFDGRIRVVHFIDYGDHGRNHVDGRTYKSQAGALKFALAWIGKAA